MSSPTSKTMFYFKKKNGILKLTLADLAEFFIKSGPLLVDRVITPMNDLK